MKADAEAKKVLSAQISLLKEEINALESMNASLITKHSFLDEQTKTLAVQVALKSQKESTPLKESITLDASQDISDTAPDISVDASDAFSETCDGSFEEESLCGDWSIPSSTKKNKKQQPAKTFTSLKIMTGGGNPKIFRDRVNEVLAIIKEKEINYPEENKIFLERDREKYPFMEITLSCKSLTNSSYIPMYWKNGDNVTHFGALFNELDLGYQLTLPGEGLRATFVKG